MSILGFLTGRNGGATLADIQNLTRRSKFSDYLPWIAYDPATRVYLNTDNTVGCMWECVPLCFAGDPTQTALEGLFRIGFPEGSVLQFTLFADPDLQNFLDAHKSTRARDLPLAEHATRELCRFLLESCKKNSFGAPFRIFRLFISLKIPIDKAQGLNMDETRGGVEETLTGAGLFPTPAEPSALLDWMRRVFNAEVSQNNGPWDENVPIRKQIIRSESDVNIGFDSIEAGGKTFRCMTPKAFPKQVSPLQTNQLFGGIWGMVSDAEQVSSPFIYTLNVVFEDLWASLHRKCNAVLMQQGVGSFAPSLARKQEEYLWATDTLESGRKFLRIIPILWVYGDDPRRVDDSAKRARRIWEGQGYETQADRGILPILFVSALPFGLYNVDSNVDDIDRDFITPQDTIAAVLPVQADISGGGLPVLTIIGRKGQVCGLDIFDSAAINHNLFIAAGSGGGKSFLVNYISGNYYSAGAKVRIIDIGGSYKKMTKMYGARYLEFSGKEDISLNPFSTVVDEEYDLPVVTAIMAQMAYSASDKQTPQETEMSLLKDAVRWAWRRYGRDAGVDAVREFLNAFPKHAEEFEDNLNADINAQDITKAARELAYNLKEFGSGGLYGKYFNGPATFDISKDDFVVLELEHLKPIRELFRVVTLQVINAVTQDMYLSDRSTPKLVIFDEASMFLSGGESGILKKVIEEGYRRARKYNGSFTVVTQSILDLRDFGPVGRVIRSNSAFKFYLQSVDFEETRTEGLLDADEFTMRLLKSVRTVKPRYSEMFMDTPFGMGVARLIVDPFSYYVYTSDAKEIAEIEALVTGGVTYEEAIEEMRRRRKT